VKAGAAILGAQLLDQRTFAGAGRTRHPDYFGTACLWEQKFQEDVPGRVAVLDG